MFKARLPHKEFRASLDCLRQKESLLVIKRRQTWLNTFSPDHGRQMKTRRNSCALWVVVSNTGRDVFWPCNFVVKNCILKSGLGYKMFI